MPVPDSLVMVRKLKHEGKTCFQTFTAALVSGIRYFPKEEILEPAFPATKTNQIDLIIGFKIFTGLLGMDPSLLFRRGKNHRRWKGLTFRRGREVLI